MTASQARKYARGLLDAMPEGGDAGAVADAIAEAADAVAQSTLRDVLTNPAVGLPASGWVSG